MVAAEPPLPVPATAKLTATKAGYKHQRGRTRQQQGYGRPWEILRVKILKRDKYLCQMCLEKGIATAAKAVDHIKAKAFGGAGG